MPGKTIDFNQVRTSGDVRLATSIARSGIMQA